MFFHHVPCPKRGKDTKMMSLGRTQDSARVTLEVVLRPQLDHWRSEEGG